MRNHNVVHLKNKYGGADIGVQKISADVNSDFWAQVRQFIEDYSKVYPKEMYEVLQETQRLREEAERASKVGILGRNAYNIPVGLAVMLNNNFPELFADKNLTHMFMKKFPGFTIPNKI